MADTKTQPTYTKEALALTIEKVDALETSLGTVRARIAKADTGGALKALNTAQSRMLDLRSQLDVPLIPTPKKKDK